MTDLTKNAPIKLELGDFNMIPAAAVDIHEGSLTFLDSSGYATGVLTQGTVFLGHAFGQCLNSGGDAGDINCQIRQQNYLVEITLAAVALTDVGKAVYCTDNATFTLARSGPRVGKVWRYVTTNTCVILVEPLKREDLLRGGIIQNVAHDDTADFLLIPGWANPSGLLITSFFAQITEIMAGATEDQMIITVSDESDNSLGTLEPSDAITDVVDDIVVGYMIQAASTGDALITVAAGEYIDCAVTQPTAGTPGGEMTVFIEAIPLL